MLKKLRYFGFFMLASLLMAACEIYRLPAAAGVVEMTTTPEPKIKAPMISLEVQAGNTDMIVILGILIFALIIIPILLHYRDWRSP